MTLGHAQRGKAKGGRDNVELDCWIKDRAHGLTCEEDH